MANWSDLKSGIAKVIRTNGAQEITGKLLQDALNSIISNVGKDSTFAGIANPGTNPGVPDGNVFYLATKAGTYVNFGGIVISDGEAVILDFRNGKWIKETTGFATEEELRTLGMKGGNKILEWKTDVATTRKQVPQDERKAGIQISYKDPNRGWINEQYLETSFTDNAWTNDKSWILLPNNDDLYRSAFLERTDTLTSDNPRLFPFEYPKGKKLFVKVVYEGENFLNIQLSGREGNLPMIQYTNESNGKWIEYVPTKPISTIGYVIAGPQYKINIILCSEITAISVKNREEIGAKANQSDLNNIADLNNLNHKVIVDGIFKSENYDKAVTTNFNYYGFVPTMQIKCKGIKNVYVQDNAKDLKDVYAVAIKSDDGVNYYGVRKSPMVWNAEKERYDTNLLVNFANGEKYAFMTTDPLSQIKAVEAADSNVADNVIPSASVANKLLSLSPSTTTRLNTLKTKAIKHRIVPITDIFTQEEGEALENNLKNKVDKPQFYGVKDTKYFGNGLVSNDTLSVEIWAKMYKPSKNTALFGSSLDQMRIYIDINNNINGAGFDGDNNYLKIKTDFNFKEGEVVHCVMVYDYIQNKVLLYINGTLKGEVPVSGNNKKISHIFTCNNSYIALARAYKKALTAEEVLSLYNYNQPSEVNIPSNLQESVLYNYAQVSINKTEWKDANGNVALTMAFTSPTLLEHQIFSDAKDILYLQEITENLSNVIANTSRCKFDIVEFTKRASHDCTFVGDRIWSFNKPGDGGNVYSVKPDGTDGKQICTIKFMDSNNLSLEMKSIDYVNGMLAVGNGSATTGGENHRDYKHVVYVFYETQNWEYTASGNTIPITFKNCGEYTEIDFSELGYKMYGYWGAPDTMYLSCNLFNDVYLVQLGKGTNNLGAGIYSVADANRYNGTYKVIKHWHQDGALGGFSAHGGQFYKDSLYIASNDFTKCLIYKCILQEDGKLRFEELHFDVYPENGQEVNYGGTKYYLKYSYIDGMCIKDGKLYAQPLNVDGKQTGSQVIVADI